MNDEKRSSLRLFGFVRLLPFLRPYMKRIIKMVALGCVVSLIDAVFPLFNRYALDRFAIGRTLSGLVPFIAMYVCVLVTQVIMNFVSVYD